MSKKEQASLGRQNILSVLCGLKTKPKISSLKRSRSPSSAAVSEVQTKTDNKRRNENIVDTNVNQSTFDHMTWPRFSLREDGIIAQLSIPESQRVPLLISDIRVLLNQFLMPKFYDKSAKCWYKLSASKNASQMTLLILDGVSTDTFRDLYRCHDPTKINMYYKRMLKEGRITSHAGDYERKTNLQNQICKNDLDFVNKSEVQSDKIKKDSQCVHKATKDVGPGKKKVFNLNNSGDNMDTNNSISDGVNTPANLQSLLCTWLPQTSSVLNNCIEMVAPSIYGHTIVQDLLVVRVPSARRFCFTNRRKNRNVRYKPIATMKKRKPEIVLYNQATGNTQHSMQQPASISSKQEDRVCDDSSGNDEKDCLNFPFYNELKKQNCKPLDTLDKRWIWNQDLKSRSIKFYKQDKCGRRKLLMSVDQMVKMKCPILPELLVKHNITSPFQVGSSKLIRTKSMYTPVAASSPMFGIDCEFYSDYSPLRIAIVNECGTVVYHRYISHPDNTEENSHSVVTLEEVQSEIIHQLPPNAILVGHSIGHDLTALQMHHPFLIDTSLHYDIGDKTQKLRTLARKFLDKEIQLEKKRYHDPQEDARCAMELAQLKLKTSISFGNRKLGGYVPDMHKQNDLSTTEDLVYYYNMFEMLEEQLGNFSTTECCFRTKVCLMSTANNVDLWNYRLQSVSFPLQRREVSDNKQLWNTMCSEAPDCDLIIAHFQENPRLHSNKAKVRLNALAKLDRLITSAYNSVPDKSLFVVMFTGSGLDTLPQDRSNGVVMIGRKGNVKIPTDP